MRARLYALLLLGPAASAWAGRAAAPAPRGAGFFAPFAAAMSTVLKENPGLAEKSPVLRALQGLDTSQDYQVRRFRLLALSMEPAGSAFDPAAWKNLPAAQRETVLLRAARLAQNMGEARVQKALLAATRPDAKDRAELERLSGQIEDIFFYEAPYLTSNQRDLARTALQRVQAELAARRTGETLENAYAAAETLQGTAPQAQAVDASGSEGWLWDKPAEEDGAAPPPRAAPGSRYDLQRAASDITPLVRSRDRFMPRLQRAAAARDEKTFWKLAHATYRELAREMRRDGLSEISKHIYGPWAQTRLAAYERMLDALDAGIRAVRAEHGIADWGPGGRGQQGARRTAEKAIGRVWEAKLDEETRRERKILAASRALANSARSDIAGPVFKLVALHARWMNSARDNPDPHLLPLLKEQARDGEWPGLERARDTWRRAMEHGNIPRALRINGVIRAALMLATGAALLLLGGGQWAGALIVTFGALTLFVFLREIIAADRFQNLGREFDDLLSPL